MVLPSGFPEGSGRAQPLRFIGDTRQKLWLPDWHGIHGWALVSSVDRDGRRDIEAAVAPKLGDNRAGAGLCGDGRAAIWSDNDHGLRRLLLRGHGLSKDCAVKGRDHARRHFYGRAVAKIRRSLLDPITVWRADHAPRLLLLGCFAPRDSEGGKED